MPINLQQECLLSLSQAAHSLPSCRGGRPISPATIWRWIVAGTRRLDGRVVRLEATRIGSRWLTSQEALARYSQALTSNGQAPVPTAKVKKSTKRKLEAAGIA
jgi:hypothetical protein